RKTVSVLFCDVTGSTSLGEAVDPEALRTLLARYFERMKTIVESHGGTVEKFIGDAVMAVFGVPVLHEDDALRAVRAAAEMRDAEARRGDAAFVGRSDELESLRRAFARAEHERTCVLYTLLGAAGVGKSRLVDELLAQLDGPLVVRGRCLSYGEGITYFPVVEVLKQLLGPDPDARLGELT